MEITTKKKKKKPWKIKNERRDVACKDSNCFVLHVSFFFSVNNVWNWHDFSNVSFWTGNLSKLYLEEKNKMYCYSFSFWAGFRPTTSVFHSLWQVKWITMIASSVLTWCPNSSPPLTCQHYFAYQILTSIVLTSWTMINGLNNHIPPCFLLWKKNQ